MLATVWRRGRVTAGAASRGGPAGPGGRMVPTAAVIPEGHRRRDRVGPGGCVPPAYAWCPTAAGAGGRVARPGRRIPRPQATPSGNSVSTCWAELTSSLAAMTYPESTPMSPLRILSLPRIMAASGSSSPSITCFQV